MGTLLTDKNLLLLDAFTTEALEGVRTLLNKVFEGVKDCAITLPPPSDSLDQEKRKLIETIRQRFTT